MRGKVCFFHVSLSSTFYDANRTNNDAKTDASGFKNYDPKLGLNYLEFRKTFLDKDTAGLLETDLNHDYKAFVSFVRGGRDEKESDKKGTNSTSFDDK